MKKIFFSISIVILFSCNNKPNSIIDLGENLLEECSTVDDFNLQDFALRNNIVIDTTGEFGIKIAREFVGDNEIIFADTSIKVPSILKWYEDGDCNYEEAYYQQNIISLYFVDNSNYKCLNILYKRDSLGRIIFNEIDTINLNDECDRFTNHYGENRCVKAVDFRATPDKNLFSFNSGSIYVKNNSEKEVDSLVLQCQLKAYSEDYYRYTRKIEDADIKNPFYSKTYTYKKRISPNEIAQIELPEIERFYSKRKITQKNLGVSFRTIMSYPKPQIFYCKKLHQLDSISNN